MTYINPTPPPTGFEVWVTGLANTIALHPWGFLLMCILFWLVLRLISILTARIVGEWLGIAVKTYRKVVSR